MSKFETKVFLVNQYGEEIVELERDSSGYYTLPKNMYMLLFDVGDELRVEEREVEVD